MPILSLEVIIISDKNLLYDGLKIQKREWSVKKKKNRVFPEFVAKP